MGLGQLVVFRILPALALICLGLGVVWRLYAYWRLPVPWRIPLTPACRRAAESLLRYLGDQFICQGLLRANPWHWALWAGFHLCLLLVAVGHLRLVLHPVPGVLVWLAPLTSWAGYALISLLILRLTRRIFNPRLAYSSRASDYLLLLLLLAGCLSGVYLKLLHRTDLWALKHLLGGWWDLQPIAATWPGGAFLPHYLLGLLIILALPFSWLDHAMAPLLNPLRRLRDTARRKRHINPWDQEHPEDELGGEIPLPGDAPLTSYIDYQMRLRSQGED